MSIKNLTWSFVIIIILFGNSSLSAQNEKEQESNNPTYILVNLSYSFQSPKGDMSNRYGWNNSAGLGIDYLTSENWIFGTQVDYLFGTRVKEDVLATLRNQNGDLIGNNRSIANIRLTERGWNANFLFGKLIPFRKEKRLFGIRATAGVGILQHKIRIQQDPASLVPQTTGDYRTGYDRMSNGLAFTEFIGIQKVSPNRRINFIIGVELVQGFTKSRREWDFDKMAKDENSYIDFLIGGKFAWTIPFEIGATAEDVFY
ncbi:MAG: hypothetical protein AB8H03_02505 [Saprospiraceae bacterium]